MNLPSGIYYRPLQHQLIALDAEAVIRIDTQTELANQGYVVERRDFDASFERALKGDWDELDRIFHLERLVDPASDKRITVYARAHHTKLPRRPGITVVPNLRATEKSETERPLHVLGCTLARRYVKPDSGSIVRHVYEFLSYGMMLIDSGQGDVDLWVGRAGDKVVVTSGCSMALYNLGDVNSPLIMLDFCNDEGQVEEARLSTEIGPMLLIRYDDLEVNFAINRLYVNNRDIKAGVRVAPSDVEKLGRTVRLQRTSRDDLGTFLYEQLTQNAPFISRFGRLGVCIRNVATDVRLRASSDGAQRSLFFSRALARAAAPGTRVYRFFFPRSPEARPLDVRSPPQAEHELTRATHPSKPLDRALVVVVEGAGDWVEKAYRQAFRDKIAQAKKGYALKVFYTDDTTWKLGRDGKPTRPGWAHRGQDGLADWEVYLDKSDPADAARYALLRPDAVFVVTPDFMHAQTARYWLNKTPVVFVEKPFDSQVRNVEDLQFSLFGRPRTEIIGLDHYQFYAEPLKLLRREIDERVGTTLTNIDFILVERNAIEKGRDRSLQHGLSLDLLPHFIALLTFFGDIRTIDEISVPKAWRYDPLESRKAEETEKEDISKSFKNETGSLVEFTFEDYSGNGYRVPCSAIVGKGFSADAKYMEVTGTKGGTLRIDLRSRPKKGAPDFDTADKNYPWDSVFFLAGQGDPCIEVDDPYRPAKKLRILTINDQVRSVKLERRRYSTLLADLLEGTDTAAFSSLSIAQGGHIVKVLDRIWWAIQQSKPWDVHTLQNFDAVAALDALP